MARKKTKTPSTPTIVETVVSKSIPPEKTLAEKMWDQIKNVELSMFGLPNQFVSKYCSPVFIEPNKLYLSYKIGLLLPTMEEVFRNKYDVALVDKYITVVPHKE